MPKGVYVHKTGPRIKDEFSHLSTANAWYHRHKDEVSQKTKELSTEKRAEKNAKSRARHLANPEPARTRNKKYKQMLDPRKTMLENAKGRAKRFNLPFNITLEDIVVPEICPIAQIPMVFHKGKTKDNSPSLDKIVPALGYVKGNISVISRKGNRWKQEMTREDVIRVLDYIDRKI